MNLIDELVNAAMHEPPYRPTAVTKPAIVEHAPKFVRGQAVLFSPGAMDGNAPRGSYIVLLCLPDDGIGFQYSIKSARDAHERIVREHRLKAAGSPPENLPAKSI